MISEYAAQSMYVLMVNRHKPDIGRVVVDVLGAIALLYILDNFLVFEVIFSQIWQNYVLR